MGTAASSGSPASTPERRRPSPHNNSENLSPNNPNSKPTATALPIGEYTLLFLVYEK